MIFKDWSFHLDLQDYLLNSTILFYSFIKCIIWQGLESILNAQNVESGVNLSLRSEGGEVILVSKKFFASDANLSKALDAASKTVGIWLYKKSKASINFHSVNMLLAIFRGKSSICCAQYYVQGLSML